MRELLLSLLGLVAPQPAQPRAAPYVAPVEKRRSLRIPFAALGRERASLEHLNVRPPLPFAVAPPPRGVVPDGETPMAMDENLGDFVSGQRFYTDNLSWLGMPYLAELSQRAEFRQIVETLAKDMTRRWIKLTSKGDEDKSGRIAIIEDKLNKYKIRQKFRRLAELDGFFGRGHLYIDNGCSDDRELLKVAMILDRRTFEPGSLRDFRVVEPMWTYPANYDSLDPLKEGFYAPRTWYVFGKELHRTRLLTLISREVPDLLKPQYQFGGISLTQLAKPYVDNWLRTRQSVSDLVHSFSTMILKTDMKDLLQDGAAQTLYDRVELYNTMRDNRGSMVIDKESEDLANVSTPLGTLDRLQAQAQEQMAAVSHTPLIILLGITPSGLNASSDGELQTWAAWVRSMQEHLFDDPLRRVIEVIQLNEWGDIDPDISFDYEPLRELSDAELAAARRQEADTHAIYVNAGVVAPDEVRQVLANDEGSAYTGVDLSGPPPDPPVQPGMEDDPLGMPKSGSAGEGMESGGEAKDDDPLAGVVEAIEARREEDAYEYWLHSRDE